MKYSPVQIHFEATSLNCISPIAYIPSDLINICFLNWNRIDILCYWFHFSLFLSLYFIHETDCFMFFEFESVYLAGKRNRRNEQKEIFSPKIESFVGLKWFVNCFAWSLLACIEIAVFVTCVRKKTNQNSISIPDSISNQSFWIGNKNCLTNNNTIDNDDDDDNGDNNINN